MLMMNLTKSHLLTSLVGQFPLCGAGEKISDAKQLNRHEFGSTVSDTGGITVLAFTIQLIKHC